MREKAASDPVHRNGDAVAFEQTTHDTVFVVRSDDLRRALQHSWVSVCRSDGMGRRSEKTEIVEVIATGDHVGADETASFSQRRDCSALLSEGVLNLDLRPTGAVMVLGVVDGRLFAQSLAQMLCNTGRLGVADEPDDRCDPSPSGLEQVIAPH